MVQTSPVQFLRTRFLMLRLRPKIAHRINSRFLVIVDYTHVFGKLELQCRERESAIPPKISPFLPPMPFLAPFFPFGRDENCPRPKPRRRLRWRRHLSLIFSAQKPKRNDEFVVAILPSFLPSFRPPSVLSCQDGPDTHQDAAPQTCGQTLLLSFSPMEPQGKLFICAFLVN